MAIVISVIISSSRKNSSLFKPVVLLTIEMKDFDINADIKKILYILHKKYSENMIYPGQKPVPGNIYQGKRQCPALIF